MPKINDAQAAALAQPSEAQLDEIQKQHNKAKAAGEVQVFGDTNSIREHTKTQHR